MLQVRNVHLLLPRSIYLMSRLFGLLAATVPRLSSLHPQGGVRCNRYWRLHGYLVFLFVLCYSPHAFYMVSTRMVFLRQNHLLLILGCHRYAFVLFTALVTLYLHTTQQKEFIAWLNKLLWCRRRLLKMLPHATSLKASALQLHKRAYLWTIYALTISIIFSSSHSIFILWNDPMARRSWLFFCSVCFFYGCQLGLQLCLGVYLLGLLMLSHLSHHCNLLLAGILADAVSAHDRLCHLPRRFRLHAAQQHWLALELWRLWRLQGELMQLSRRLCSLHSFQLLSFVIFVPIEVVIHSFFGYFVAFSRWWLRKFGKPGRFNSFGLLFVLALFLQLSLVLMHTHRQRRIFEETRRVLRDSALELSPDCSKALRQTVDFYGLQLQLNERIFKLSACGLFELNNGLLFGIMQTIIIYIMIIIQFDKIINT